MDGGDGPFQTRARRPRPSLEERREERRRVEDPAIVLAAAARFLEARARSEQEVRRRLADAGYRSDLVDAAITRLVELGLLDDGRFARAWVESRDRARPRGTRVLRGELARKGVDAATVDDVMAERNDPPADVDAGVVAWGSRRLALEAGVAADEAAARRLLERHGPALRRVTDLRKRRQRAYGLLARSGFDAALIGDLVREAAREWEAASDPAGGDGGEDDPGTNQALGD